MCVQIHGNTTSVSFSIPPWLLFASVYSVQDPPSARESLPHRVCYYKLFETYHFLHRRVRFSLESSIGIHPRRCSSATSEQEDSISGWTSAGADWLRGLCLTRPTLAKSSQAHLFSTCSTPISLFSILSFYGILRRGIPIIGS